MARGKHEIEIKGLGTLTRRGEIVLSVLIIAVFLAVMATAGWVEQR